MMHRNQKNVASRNGKWKEGVVCLAILTVICICTVCICSAGQELHTKGASEQEACEEGEESGEGGAQSAKTSLSAWVNKSKRYRTYPIESHLQEKDAYYNYDNQKLAWWFKRDKNHGPSGCDDTVDLSEFEAYYLDENAANKNEKVVYLTLDCGYDNGYTEPMLDILKKEDVPACFFVTQTYIRDNVAIVKRMKKEGHQVGNHTIYHICMPEKSYEEIVQEVTGCAEYMKEATGYDMDPYLRPPSGEYSARTLAITRDLGYETVFWSMAYLDYDVNNQPGVDFVIDHFEKYHHSGAIILMHNVSSSNAGALEKVIANLKAQGYRFASLNELK